MKNYLPHIDALRGIAIMMVLLYHLWPGVCPHGYFGVDMFLMVSGYFLVAGLLKNEGKDFSIAAFIQKKLLRLFPPLLVMIMVMVPVGMWVMTGDELSFAAKTAYNALLGKANIFLNENSLGYFAGDSQNNPFLHTWYLSVIMQVYLIFALSVLVLKRFSVQVKWMVVLLLGVFSLGFIAYARVIVPAMEPYTEIPPLYYQTWSRVFEVVAGACILLLPKNKSRLIGKWFAIPAFLIVIFCCFAPEKNMGLLLCASGVMIWLVPEGVSAGLMNNAVWRYLGKCSFSIYLWHWPIIVYSCYCQEHRTVLGDVLLFAVCLGVGILFFHLVEKRRWRLWVTVLVWCAAAAGSYFVAVSANIGKMLHPGVHAVLESQHVSLRAIPWGDFDGSATQTWLFPEGTAADTESEKVLVQLGDTCQPPSFVLLGDSHARAFAPGMSVIAERLKLSGYYAPLYVTPFHDRMCTRSRYRFSAQDADALLAWLEKHGEIKNVVLMQRWSIRMREQGINDEAMPLRYDGSYVPLTDVYQDTESALIQFCDRLSKIGKQVIVVTEVPPVKTKPAPFLRRALLHHHSTDSELLTCTTEHYHSLFKRQLETFDKMSRDGVCKVVPIHSALLKDGVFRAYAHHAVLMYDDDHISASGAIIYAREHYADWRSLLCPAASDAGAECGVGGGY